ncbi:hypothetical protein QYE76_014715 [Lolium multiflorum]|uniref:Uncharacterized protein n=1 Tax=Lolium multiflorum TaxID=4521 RepID=A0AAD8U523_LOLMU|nr:hypothetical protein QYE76_014715 [Lolium multiflorum]
MVKKKSATTAASSTSEGAAAKPPSIHSKGGAPSAPPPAPAPPAPSSSVAKPGNWPASTVTKRDPKPGTYLLRRGESVEEARTSPVKRSIGGFADEDDLLDWDEGFVEPPPKRAKPDIVPPAAVASEASAPQAAPAAQASTASSLSKGKDIPATTMAPPSDLRGVISSLEAFASQFTSLEADNVRLQEEVKSSSSKLNGAIKKASIACQEVDSLKEELGKLKERLKEEETRAAEKDELLQKSSLALLEAANIPAAALDAAPNNSPANGVSMALASHQLTRELLERGKRALARMHLMIFPKLKQDKTPGQLVEAFAVDTKEVIEVFPVPSFVDDSSGALPEVDRIQRMKDRIAQMEKDLRSTYALAAIVNKKSEIATDVERYALTELRKATDSLIELPFPEKVTRLRLPSLELTYECVTGSVDLPAKGRLGVLCAVVYSCHGSRVVIAVLSIVSSFVIPIVMSIGVSYGYQVAIVIVAVLPPLVLIPSAARIHLRLVVIFIIAALPRSSHVVLTISPAVGDFH